MARDKPALQVRETYLQRDLSEFDITMIGVGAMIGAGIFVLTGIAAGAAGPALILSFALNGIVTIFTAMVYAELGSAIPESGGGYLWVKEAFGSSHAFLAGWMSWFSHAVAGALYALGFGAYFALLLHRLPLPFSLPDLPGGLLEKGLGVAVTLVFVYINFRGTSETGMAGNIVTLGKLAIIALFIGFGLWAMFQDPDLERKFEPFYPKGLDSVFIAMGLTFIAFEGYEIIVQAGEEVKNPRRTIPRAVFWSLIIVVPIYVLVGLTSIGAVSSAGPSWQFLGEHKELGLVRAAEQFLPFGSFLLLFGGLLSTVSALNATTFSSTRVAFAMGRDKALPDLFARIHSRTRTPYMALFGTGLIILAMVLAIPIEEVATAADVMFLLLFVQVNVAVMALRREHGDRLRYGYLMPFYPWVPLIGILLKAFLAIYLYRYSPRAWFLAAGWIGVGIVLFLAYARSRLRESQRPRVARRREVPRQREASGTDILVAVTGDSPAESELRVAAALARARNTELVAVNVVQVPRQTSLREAAGRTAESGDLVAKLERFAKREEISLQSLIAVGHSVSGALTDVVTAEKIPLTVLGWRGQVHEKSIRGSIADAVLGKTPSDVLVVRDRGLPERVERIVLATSRGIRDAVTQQAAIDLARGFDSELRVVTFIEGERDEELADWQQDLRRTFLEQDFPEERLEMEILEVPFAEQADALVREAEGADLLVMGASRDWVEREHLLGELPDRVANRSDRTVVVGKEEESKVRSVWRRLTMPFTR